MNPPTSSLVVTTHSERGSQTVALADAETGEIYAVMSGGTDAHVFAQRMAACWNAFRGVSIPTHTKGT